MPPLRACLGQGSRPPLLAALRPQRPASHASPLAARSLATPRAAGTSRSARAWPPPTLRAARSSSPGSSPKSRSAGTGTSARVGDPGGVRTGRGCFRGVKPKGPRSACRLAGPSVVLPSIPRPHQASASTSSGASATTAWSTGGRTSAAWRARGARRLWAKRHEGRTAMAGAAPPDTTRRPSLLPCCPAAASCSSGCPSPTATSLWACWRWCRRPCTTAPPRLWGGQTWRRCWPLTTRRTGWPSAKCCWGPRRRWVGGGWGMAERLRTRWRGEPTSVGAGARLVPPVSRLQLYCTAPRTPPAQGFVFSAKHKANSYAKRPAAGAAGDGASEASTATAMEEEEY